MNMILNVAPGGLLPCASRSCATRQPPLPVCHSLFNFAAVEVKETGRRNRKQEKRESQGLLRVVKGLTDMSPKQLQGVSHLLGVCVCDAITIAARIPRTNQGRKRQEGLVEKLLRNHLDKRELDKLEEAVRLSEGNSIYQDPDLVVLVEGWCEGIAAGNQDVIQEVLAAQASFMAAAGSAGSTDGGNTAGMPSGSSKVGSSRSDKERWDEESVGSSGDEDDGVGADAGSGEGSKDGVRNAEQRSLLSLIGRFRDVTQEQQEQQQWRHQQQQQQQQQGSSEERLQGAWSADVPISSISGRLAEDEDESELQRVLAMASAMAQRRGSRKRAAAAVKGGKGASDGGEGSSSSGSSSSSSSSGLSDAEKAQAQKRRKVLQSMKAALKPLATHLMASSIR
ncbi:hypothetical protein DUNSADRAFT_4482 [Dunaliella salina]|uniref:Uncharacterized protein n=1 Tax=Dunaliella salina TaxID=3046 RepID=A0ABQ7GS38_DUNSA|nr:hypothetical protein DUNSADRAFT_4482 [Dunaliella salina]|eukprot:KAF5837378.1 hypothetical protein DUNSADRAFT_4482 [Dunaliella salina]